MEKIMSRLAKSLLSRVDTTRAKLELTRHLSTCVNNSFKSTDLQTQECRPNERKAKPDWNKLVFGKFFTDHMLEVNWNLEKGWDRPEICPIHNFSLHPSAKVFHYAQELFEGIKAYRGVDGRIRIFRPDMNMKRMLSSAQRMDLPEYDEKELLECLKKLVKVDQEWIPPYGTESSLYIRPTFIGTEAALGVHSSKDAILYIILSPVGPYWGNNAVKPVELLADPRFVRAWPGGVGDKKLGTNYGPTLAVQKLAEKMGLQQVLWLFGDDHQLTEAGVMNVFAYFINENGQKELVTPPLKNGLILPGVMRLSIIQLAQTWSDVKVTERKITMNEIKHLTKEKRLLELFGSGTACVVCPIGRIHYMNEDILIPPLHESQSIQKKLFKTLTDIQYGRVPHEWGLIVE